MKRCCDMLMSNIIDFLLIECWRSALEVSSPREISEYGSASKTGEQTCPHW